MSTITKNPSDAKLLSRLRRTSKGLTASQLGTTSARLREMEGVFEVGQVSTGKPGRPAILFSAEAVVEDPSVAIRTGASNAVVA